MELSRPQTLVSVHSHRKQKYDVSLEDVDAEILEDEWFKKDYKPPHFEQTGDVGLEDVDAAFNSSEEDLVAEKREKPESMNAFALISRSQGFNLGNLFEKEMMERNLSSENSVLCEDYKVLLLLDLATSVAVAARSPGAGANEDSNKDK